MKTFDEQWKPVNGYEGLYEVSSLGRVKSLKYGKEKTLKPKKCKGYLRVSLYRNGKHKQFSVHKLVATAFIPNPYGFTEINHKDENKSNNVVSNIEWCTREYNMHFGTLYERAAASRRKAVEASRFSDFREIELRFASINEANRNGYNQGHVSACCNGCYSANRRNFYKGLYWRYAV